MNLKHFRLRFVRMSVTARLISPTAGVRQRGHLPKDYYRDVTLGALEAPVLFKEDEEEIWYA